jgi:hypothetical protein
MGNKLRVTVAGLIAAPLALLAACGPTANKGSVSNATANSPGNTQAEAPAPAADAPTWGKRYTWEDGLAVEVAAPAACEPGEYAVPDGIERAVKFTVTVVNGTNEPFDAVLLTIGGDAQFDGKKAETIIDIDGPCDSIGLDSGTVMPGKTFTYEVAYAVGPEPGEMQLTFQPAFNSDKAVYTGQA